MKQLIIGFTLVVLFGLMAGCDSKPESKSTEPLPSVPEFMPEAVHDSVFYRSYNRFDAERWQYPHPRLLPVECVSPPETID